MRIDFYSQNCDLERSFTRTLKVGAKTMPVT